MTLPEEQAMSGNRVARGIFPRERLSGGFAPNPIVAADCKRPNAKLKIYAPLAATIDRAKVPRVLEERSALLAAGFGGLGERMTRIGVLAVLLLVACVGVAIVVSTYERHTAQVVDAPPCSNGSAECLPWERVWNATKLRPGAIVTSRGEVISLGFGPAIRLIVGIAPSLFGTFFGAWFAYELGKLRDDRATKIRAAVDFRDAVHAALQGVYPLTAVWPDDVDYYFKTAFPSIQLAVARFRPFIPQKQRPAFDSAWKLYRLGDEGREIDVQLYHQYMPFESNPDPKRRLFDNVAALLRFAE